MITQPIQLYDHRGRRKYLTSTERILFAKSCLSQPEDRKLFCLTLLYSGCRISEALELTAERIDPLVNLVIFRTLKKRDFVHQRAVPLPPKLLTLLEGLSKSPSDRLWKFSRTTGWRIIKEVMKDAGIASGAHNSPKGIRHAYGVSSIENNISLPTLMEFMGHSSIQTTRIYLSVVGDEKFKLASRTWEGLSDLYP